jgi:SAM-dependent methyltransferase
MTIINKNFFDKRYFESGIESKKSCYVNYRWIPELTIPMCYHITKYLNLNLNQKILDFGCAKGYVVRALRLLNFKAYGVDISKYAIENADNQTKKYLKLINEKNCNPFKFGFDWIITKDVMEHMSLHSIKNFLNDYREKSKNMFHIIPLGDSVRGGGKFRINEMHLDKSHIQIHNEKWWEKIFKENGWKILSLKYKIEGLKDNWSNNHPKGNGFFILQKI